MTNLAELLVFYCRLRNISQNTVADEIGIGHSNISRFLKGKRLDQQNTLKIINWLFKEQQGTVAP